MVNPDSIPHHEQHMDQPEVDQCRKCIYYKCIGNITACVYNIFHAVKLENLLTEDLVRVRPFDEACNKYKEADSV